MLFVIQLNWILYVLWLPRDIALCSKLEHRVHVLVMQLCGAYAQLLVPLKGQHVKVQVTRHHDRAGNGSLRVTHDPRDPWPMGHRGRHLILAQALHRFVDCPALYLDIVYVDTPLSCYIIPHVSKMHIQTPVNLEFWYIIIAIIYKPSHRVKNWWVMGQHLVTHDPCDPSDFRDPFDPWPMTHDPSTHSLLWSRMIWLSLLVHIRISLSWNGFSNSDAGNFQVMYFQGSWTIA